MQGQRAGQQYRQYRQHSPLISEPMALAAVARTSGSGSISADCMGQGGKSVRLWAITVGMCVLCERVESFDLQQTPQAAPPSSLEPGTQLDLGGAS